ncbi:hypothetical protein [Massilia aerilata]|uniref:Uncharacterized protein n=1 Tax=Massilia aerilata TaxID=453817 RepID=A0ABW0S4H4_9BURK
MNKERFWPRALGAVAIVALVLVTNEGYRRVRSLIDAVDQSKHDIAQLKRDLYVLQVQLDNGPVAAKPQVAVAAPVVMNAPTIPAALPVPLPVPMAPTLDLPSAPARPRPKAQSSDETKSLVNVVLMSDAKAPAASSATAKPADGPKIDVRLIGESK